MLQASTQVVPICDLPAALAEELIHFIFRNEDRFVVVECMSCSLKLFVCQSVEIPWG